MGSGRDAGVATLVRLGKEGRVENTNKRIRRYLPGTTDLAAVSQCENSSKR
jgi:hypothetical protein